MIFNTFFNFNSNSKLENKNFEELIKKFFTEKDFQKIFSEIQKKIPEDRKNFLDKKKFFWFENKEINLFFVYDEEIKKLNLEFRNKNSATDCLSFEKTDEDKKDPFDNVFWECFIAMPYIKNQAEEYWVSLKYEITKMIIHSVLHLYWYDHIEDEDFLEMSKVEKEIMIELK